MSSWWSSQRLALNPQPKHNFDFVLILSHSTQCQARVSITKRSKYPKKNRRQTSQIKIQLARTRNAARRRRKSEEEPCGWSRVVRLNAKEKRNDDHEGRKSAGKSEADSLKSRLIEHHRPPARTSHFLKSNFFTFREAKNHK